MYIRQLISVGLLMVLAVSTYADDMEHMVKYRQSVMKVIGGHMGAMGTVLRGNVYGENFALHASGMADASKVVGDIFPAGSGTGKTEALPRIWNEPEEFAKAVKAFQDAAANLAGAAEGGDQAAVMGAMRKLGGTCKGCHDDFKEE